jgi:hypothetical protein
MSLQYSPKITTDGLVMCLDPSQNKSYPTTDLPVKGGLVMWMDAADDTTFSYSSGTTVSQWRDKSGFNYHMVPVSAGPTRNAFLNSRKVIACTTSQQIWNSAINLVTSAYTIFCVTRLSGINPNRVLSTLYTGATGTNWLLGHWGGHYNQYYAEGWVQYQGYPADNTWRMYMGDWSGSSTDLANLYSNGTAITTNSNGANAGPLGLGVNISSEVSTCEAAEIIVFNRLLTTTERRLVHTYLGQKWGISNTDRSIIDLAGNDDNGLFGNGTVANMPSYDFYNKGTLRFDGANDYVFLSNSQLNISSAITVEAWVKYNAQGGYNARSYSVITCKGYPWTWLLEDQSGQFNFRISTSVNSDSNVNSSYSHGLNTWNHVVGTYDGTSQKIYVDGVLRNTVSLTGTINTSSNDALVGLYNYGDYCLTGNVGAVTVYNKALSAVEVAQNYEAQKSKFANTIVQQGLVLNLDAGNPYSYAGAGTTWIDVSGNSNNGTLINSPTYSSDNSGVLNWASVSSQYATVAMNSGLRVTNITQEVWVFLNSTADQVFIGMQYGTGSNNSFALWVSGGTFYFGVNTGGTFYQSASSTPSTSTWYHLVHTYNGTTQYLYINGVLVTTYNSAASGNITYDTSNTLLAIGADFNGTGYNTGPTLFVNGKMPIVKIYNIALSAAQVLQNYNAIKGRFGL